MHAHKTKVTISEDHELAVTLPEDFPSGPAEVIVLAESPSQSRVVRLGGVLASGELDEISSGDPVAEALDELRRQRAWST